MKKLAVLLSIFLTAQAVSSTNTLYEQVTFNKPSVGASAEVYLGDRMLTQQVGEWKECITPIRTYSKKFMGWTGIYKGGEPACKTSLKEKYYQPTYANASYGGEERTSKLRWKGKKGKYSLCQMDSGVGIYCIKKLKEEDIEFGETFIYKPNSFQQSVEYAGKSGNILKFNYSEFSGGFARQAFTREFQVDLSEGSIAAYKGAIIEILEATNVQIKYKVIRNFSSDS